MLLAVTMALAMAPALPEGAAVQGAGEGAAIQGAGEGAPERRFALVIGHNEGNDGEVPLKFARLDAERMAGVFGRVGGFQARDTVTLVDDRDDATAVLEALDELEVRVRAASVAGPTLLLVYYSGHASQSALHLGGSEVPLRELDRRLQESQATVRLLVLDACRSGSLTRVKGDATFPVMGASGYAVVTASAAGEDAAESDQLQGSFFTHAFSSGLLGPADDDGDGQVTLNEAYGHAFDHTVRLSTSSSGNVQHPTFRYDLRGRSDLVLARFGDEQAMVMAPERTRFLLLSAGRVIAEVADNDDIRGVAVAPGSYTVIARTPDAIYEGDIVVEPGQSTTVDLSALSSSSFARLARKGGSDDARRVIVGVAAGPLLLGGSLPLAAGMQVQVPVTLSWATVTPRLDVSRGDTWRFTALPDGEIHQQYLQLRLTTMLSAVVDASWVSASVGVLGGVQLLQQETVRSFSSSEDVVAVGGVAGVDVAVQLPFLDRWFVEAGLESSVSTITEQPGLLQATSLQVAPRLLAGIWF